MNVSLVIVYTGSGPTLSSIFKVGTELQNVSFYVYSLILRENPHEPLRVSKVFLIYF